MIQATIARAIRAEQHRAAAPSVNRWYRRGLIAKAAQLRAEAEAASPPQYRGHWDGWGLGVMRADVTTKAGLAFREGDMVLVKTGLFTLGSQCPKYIAAFSLRTNADTSVLAAEIEIIF